jgi:hypothetical protein
MNLTSYEIKISDTFNCIPEGFYHHIDMEMTRLSNMQSRSTSFFLLLKKGGEGETYVHIVFPQIFHVFSKLSQIVSHLIPYPCPKALLL